MSGFFQELQRRKVYRVEPHIIAAGFIIQIGSGYSSMGIAELDTASCHRAFAGRFSGRAHPRLGLRRNAARSTPPQRLPGRHRRRNITSPRRRRHDNFYRCGIFSLAARLSAQDRQVDRGSAVSEILDAQKENAYFADGIQNEILTKLATVHLKVISRTSTAKSPSKPDNLKTVAQELGVSAILE